MKKVSYLSMPLILIIVFSSCAPVYRCGDPRPVKTPITWSKNMKQVIRERDRLCIDLASKENENVLLNTNLTDMTGKNKEQTEQYTD